MSVSGTPGIPPRKLIVFFLVLIVVLLIYIIYILKVEFRNNRSLYYKLNPSQSTQVDTSKADTLIIFKGSER